MTTSTVGLGWHPGLQGTWAAAGATVSKHDNLADAIAAAEAGGHTIINEAVERSKFIVREVADPCDVVLQEFPNGPWRVHALPWRSIFVWSTV